MLLWFFRKTLICMNKASLWFFGQDFLLLLFCWCCGREKDVMFFLWFLKLIFWVLVGCWFCFPHSMDVWFCNSKNIFIFYFFERWFVLNFIWGLVVGYSTKCACAFQASIFFFWGFFRIYFFFFFEIIYAVFDPANIQMVLLL